MDAMQAADFQALFVRNRPHAFAGLQTPAPHYKGKVRDVYTRGDDILLVASDRISAFDVILGTIPLKGQLLTEQAAFWLQKAAAVGRTHFVERTDPSAMRCVRTTPLPVELVVRGYLAGSLLREPAETRGAAYGLRIDPQLAAYAPFPTPVVTPTTKEAVGEHDQPCSPADLVKSGRISQKHLDRCIDFALALFKMGQDHAQQQGLLLVDTKYEFGLVNDEVVLIDEVHTADSSRFWWAESYAARVNSGDAPHMLDKERLRRWLLAAGFNGHGTPPALSDEICAELLAHYAELTELVTGRPLSVVEGAASERIARCVADFLTP